MYCRFVDWRGGRCTSGESEDRVQGPQTESRGPSERALSAACDDWMIAAVYVLCMVCARTLDRGTACLACSGGPRGGGQKIVTHNMRSAKEGHTEHRRRTMRTHTVTEVTARRYCKRHGTCTSTSCRSALSALTLCEFMCAFASSFIGALCL